MNMKSSTKTEAATIKTRQSQATIGCQQAERCAAHFHPPAFAPLHRFINCLMAEASGRNGVNKKEKQ